MTKAHKQHLLGIIYEFFEKRYNMAIHSNNAKSEVYKNWLRQLDNKKVESEEFRACLIQFKDYYQRLIDMPSFIDRLLNDEWQEDKDLEGNILEFETPAFF